jgi:hypothetical protein
LSAYSTPFDLRALSTQGAKLALTNHVELIHLFQHRSTDLTLYGVYPHDPTWGIVKKYTKNLITDLK